MATATKTSTRRTGRPSRSEEVERKHQLLSAALDVLLSQGFSGTSLDDIARAAHVAKRTIYEKFGGKDGLFAAAIERSATNLISRFPASNQVSGKLRADLESIGRTVLEFVLHPKSLRIYRLVAGEAERQPRPAQMFYEQGPGRVVASVADLLESYMRQERVPQGDAVALARRFIGLVVLEIHQRAVLGVLPAMSATAIERHAAAATQAFLSTLQATPRHAPAAAKDSGSNR